MTERPEERDSLAEIEERLETTHRSPTGQQYPGWMQQAVADLRTLISEVKELREENALRPSFDITDERKNVAALRDRLRQRDARIEQMEEALREIAGGPYNGFEQCKAIARAALSSLG